MSQQDSRFQARDAGGQAEPPPDSSATPPSAETSNHSDLAVQLKIAQRQVSNLLLMLLVVSGTLSIFLLQQVRYGRADMAAFRKQTQQLEQARQAIANYNQNTVPAMQKFVQQVMDYSKTHPDVLPILAKHGLVRVKREPAGTAPAEEP